MCQESIFFDILLRITFLLCLSSHSSLLCPPTCMFMEHGVRTLLPCKPVLLSRPILPCSACVLSSRSSFWSYQLSTYSRITKTSRIECIYDDLPLPVFPEFTPFLEGLNVRCSVFFLMSFPLLLLHIFRGEFPGLAFGRVLVLICLYIVLSLPLS